MQIPLIAQVLVAAGIAIAEHDGYEADDVIATLATRATQPVDVVTGSRDLFQLVGRPALGVRVLYTVEGLGNLEPVTEPEIAKKYRHDIPGDRYADFAVLRGDPSDGLPGVPGIGEKTAAPRLIPARLRRPGQPEGALDKGHGGFCGRHRQRSSKPARPLTADIAPAGGQEQATDVPVPDDIDRLGALPRRIRRTRSC